MTSSTSTRPEASDGRRGRPHARVALALLEALRDLDRPGEILDDENVTLTLPRRFGLSGVVGTQIRRYEEEAGHGRRITQGEVVDLVKLAARRPDADKLFHHVGRSLTSADGAPAWRSAYPTSFALRMGLRRIRRRLRALFGHRMVEVDGHGQRIIATWPLLVESDSSGDACAMVTGLSQAVIEAYGLQSARVTHSECVGRGDTSCVWQIEEGGGSQDDGRENNETTNEIHEIDDEELE